MRPVPEQALAVPEGLVQRGGDWIFEEFGSGGGVSAVGLDDKLPKPTNDEEKRGILDLFRR